ncbi:hypothetical protein ACFQET_06885 [Levilactobacillus tangyuanensis]|uniref:Uncharacterized protein n=1 Tax=Levilactobacillus tangyuanensis TaxID=2486021 RepID=A0ABW1TN30_9LACO|nr:hypothetical protein [Levilactobacillus tangyuanensis]
MSAADAAVKLKLVILLIVGLVALVSLLVTLFHRDRHYYQGFTGVLAVIVVQLFILGSLFTLK